MITKFFSQTVSFVAVLALVFLQISPVFALGEVSVETNIPISETVTTPEVSNTVAPVVQTITAGDTTAPDITAVLAISILPTEENVAWTTNELATSHLEYGTTLNYGNTVTLSATAGLVHLAVLTGLTPSMRYYYCINSTDLAGNTANSCGHEFTTESQPGGLSVSGNVNNNTELVVDTTPPDISLVTITSTNTTSTTVNWTTSEVGNAEVEYGVTNGYGQFTPLDTNFALNHSVTLTGLTPNTDYHYRVRSSDSLGNTSVSPDNIFTTASLNNGGEITITVLEVNTENNLTNTSTNITLFMQGVEASSVSESSATITWTTDLPSDSQIEYGENQNLGSLTTLNTSLVTSHSVVMSNLSPNTNYIFRVKSQPVGSLVVTLSVLHEFTTLSHSTPVIAPTNVSSVNDSSITTSGATVTWTTDTNATSQVEYGLSTSYGGTSPLNSSLATSHSVVLSDLDPGTTYHYRVKSTDSANNVTFSNDHIFFTLGLLQNINSNIDTNQINPQIIAPDEISNLSIGGYDQSSAVLVWRVTLNNNDLSHEYDIRYSTSPINEGNYANASETQLTPVYYGDLDPEGTAREYIVAGLSPNTTYYFAIKSKHQSGDWSAISNVVSTRTTSGVSVNNENANQSNNFNSQNTNATPTGSLGNNDLSVVNVGYGESSGGNVNLSFEPTTIKVEPANNQIIFEWNNPGEANFVRTIVVRKEVGYPSSPTDGQTLYEGSGQTFTDTNVVNSKTYYYALYSYNHSKTYSKPVRVSLSPKADNEQVKFNESRSLVAFSPILHFTKIYKKNDKNVEIEHMQEILFAENVSFPENMITGYFGSYTEKSLKLFQKKHGLAVTGMVDESTQKKLNTMSHDEVKLKVPSSFAMFNTDLKFGNQSETVKSLQEFLAYEGSYPEALITGFFGNLTKKAVMTFQKKYNIDPASGYVSYKTRHKIQQLMGL